MLHEAFKLINEDDDTTDLRKIFVNFILESSNNKELMMIINQNMAVMIQMYGNKHTIANFKGRTPYTNDSNSDGTPVSKGSGNNSGGDFTAATNSSKK